MAVDIDPASSNSGFAAPDRVVSAAWLSARLGTPGLRVIESDEDSLLYNIGHIPGAQRIDWKKDLNDPVTRDFIDGEAFAKLMREKGISRDDTVVIYGDKANWWAAYTMWVFELFGHPDVRLLDGGRDAWMGEERDTSFEVPDYPATQYPVFERDDATNRIFGAEIKESIGSDIQLIDVREESEYLGTVDVTGDSTVPSVLRTGHIPGAVSIPWGRSVHPNARFRTIADIQDRYRGFDPNKPTVVYCQLGDRSSHTWFVLKYLLGFTDIRNYDGSWAEWGNMVRVPIEVGPGASDA